MEPSIKKLSNLIDKIHIKNIVLTNVKRINFNEPAKHIVLHLDNAGPLHELETKDGDKHLKKGLEQMYGKNNTYELKLENHSSSEREKAVPHNINR